VGKADHGADLDARAVELFLGHRDVVGLDAGGGDAVFSGEAEALEDVVVGHGGVEVGVVDHFGELV
jgi:hypothetical protein